MNNKTPHPFLIFVLNDEKYCISVPHINKIINPLEIFPLPDTADFVEGLINLSGEIIPVVDLKKVINLPDMKLETNKKFILCKYQDFKVAFAVDLVVDIIEINPKEIDKNTTKVLENDFISGECILKKEAIGIIDIKRIFEIHKSK